MPRVVPSQVVEFIDQVFPFAASEPSITPPVLHRNDVGRLQGLLDLVDGIPAELLSVGAARFAEFVLAKATIRTSLPMWTPHSNHRLPSISDRTPVAIIRSVLSRCDDSAPPVSASQLTFIQDGDWRYALRSDLAGIERALANGEWKAVTVLAGSVVETLLLWGIQQKGQTAWAAAAVARASVAPRAKGDPTGWHLHEYVEIAEELGVISKDTTTQARLAKDFRNLIHPGRAERLGQVCDRATAFSAVAAVYHVVRDLGR